MSPRHQASSHHLDLKIGALERDYTHLAESLIDFRKEYKTDFEDLRRDIKKASQGPNLVAFSGWASVLLGIMIAIGTLSLAPIRHAVVENNADIKKMGINRWTKEDQQRFMDKFDETLQREMRLLDEVLQREIQLNDKIIATGLESLKKDVGVLEEKFYLHDKSKEGLGAEQSAFITSLRERVEKVEEKISEHQKDGHPYSVLSKVDILEKRLKQEE